MAYPLTRKQCLRKAKLETFEGGLEFTPPKEGMLVIDGYGDYFFIDLPYRITGTKDGNGYVLTMTIGKRILTNFFEAEVGCKLILS